jgi:hypothetical protein
MLSAFFSALSLVAFGIVQESAPVDPIPELRITANDGTVKVRIEDCKVTLSGTRVTIDSRKTTIVIEGGDKPATLMNEKSALSDKKITFDFTTNRVVIMGTGSMVLTRP